MKEGGHKEVDKVEQESPQTPTQVQLQLYCSTVILTVQLQPVCNQYVNSPYMFIIQTK